MTSIDGTTLAGNFGRSIAFVDLNGDGLSDLVVGTPLDDPGGLNDAGSVSIFLSDSGTPMNSTIVVNGTAAGDLFGWCVANIGDVDGNGTEDLAIGAPLADPGGHPGAGSVTILLGGTSFSAQNMLWINSSSDGEELGYSISRIGDVLGDGFDDIAIGAPFASASGMANAGKVHIYYGGAPMNSVADRSFSGESAGAHFGWSVSGDGNVDTDTSFDMVVGAPDHNPGTTARGAAYILRNLDRANPQISVVLGKAAGDQFGYSVAMIPDMNGDTYDDIAAGAPGNDANGSNAGQVSVLYGSSKWNTAIDLELLGHAVGEKLGWVISAGDFREDGYADVLVGAPYSNLNASSVGRAYAFFGSANPDPNADLIFVPDAGAVMFGSSVAVGQNFTGDIAPDFAVADMAFPAAGLLSSGRVYLYEGVHVVIPQNPVVRGYVRMPGTTLGLSGFTVSLEGGNLSKSAITGATGFYELVAVPGTYWLNASKTGYVPNQTTIALEMNEVMTFNFYPDTVPAVSGSVRDAVSGLAVQGASVALYNGTALLALDSTDAAGDYSMMVPDDFVPPVGQEISLTVETWDPTHYTSASPVINLARNETAVQDFSMDRFPVVSGTVRDAITLSPIVGAGVTVSQGGIQLSNDLTGGTGEYSLPAANASAPGTVLVTVTANGYYAANSSLAVERNSSYIADFVLLLDTADPTSNVVPVSSYSSSAVVSLGAVASDDNGVREVQLWYRLGMTGPYTVYGADETEPFTFDFDSDDTGGDGIYWFYSVAIDFAGKVEPTPEAPDAVTTIDTLPPTASVTSPSESQLIALSDVTLNWSMSDETSGLDSCRVAIDSEAWVPVGLNTSHEFSGLTDGYHTAWLNVTDRAGWYALDNVTFSVDTVPPLAWIAMHSIAETSIWIQWNSSDATSGVADVQVQIDNGNWISLGTEKSNESFDDLADGVHALRIRAVDSAGLVGPADQLSFTIDNAPPAAAITWPSAGQVVDSSTIVVTWTMDDALTDISRAEISLDGGSFISAGTALSLTLEGLEDGDHTIRLRVVDSYGNSAEETVSFVVDTEAGTSELLVYAAVGVAVAAILALAFMVMRRGRKAKGESKQD